MTGFYMEQNNRLKWVKKQETILTLIKLDFIMGLGNKSKTKSDLYLEPSRAFKIELL